MSGASLGERVDELLHSVEARDNERFFGALESVAHAMTDGPGAGEVQAALARLAPVLAEVPFGVGGPLATLAGGMVAGDVDPAVVVPALARRVIEAMEQAARFERHYRAAFGDPPEPGDQERIEPTIARFVDSAAEHGLAPRDAFFEAQAWFCGDEWVQPVLYLSQRADVRAMLPERARLAEAVDAMRDRYETAHWLYGLLLVLDGEPLVVLHRASGRGFRVTIGGIGDNFQLHTLLAAALVGDGSPGRLPGEPPTAAEIAAATDGADLTPPGGMRGHFNLVDAHGEWIWNEGRPADIPALDGTRVVVLDPPPYPRTWNAGRLYPLMRPTLTVDGPLPPEEAARWLDRVKPATGTVNQS